MIFNPSQDSNILRTFFAAIPDSLYYNESQNLVRVQVSTRPSRYIDLPLMDNITIPHPQEHYALVVAPEETVRNTKYSFTEEHPRFFQQPGYKARGLLVDEIPMGTVTLISRQVLQHTTNPNGIDNKNTSANDVSDPKNLKYSLSPPLRKPYTTTNSDGTSTAAPQGADGGEGNPQNENIGVFVTENSILLKTAGGSIVLGPEGITINGTIEQNNTKGSKALTWDNPFHGWIPPSFITAGLTIAYIPNLQFILNAGMMGYRLAKAGSAVREITSLV